MTMRLMYVHLPAFVRKVDELGLENVVDFLSDHVTKIWQLRYTGGLAKKKECRKKISYLLREQSKKPPLKTASGARMRMPRKKS
jgi:hypothetical protein